MLDNKGRLFGKVSIVDLGIIVFILLAALGLGFNYIASQNGKAGGGLGSLFYTDKKTMPLTIGLKVESVREMTVAAVSEGDDAYESVRNVYLGKITRIESAPFEDFISLTDGSFTRAVVPDKYVMNVSIEVDGFYRDGEYFTKDNQPLVQGSTMAFKTIKISTSGTIMNIIPAK